MKTAELRRTRRANKTTKKKLDYTQEIVTIGDIQTLLIKHKGKEYLPLSHIDQKIMLRQKGSTQSKADLDKIKMFHLDYGVLTGHYNKQNANCIEIEELKRVFIENTQVSRLSDEQIEGQNSLHEYLEIELLPVIEFELVRFNIDDLKLHDEYTRLVIQNTLEVNPNIAARVCTKCYNPYPLNETFFYIESIGYSRKCIKCKQGGDYRFKKGDKYENMLIAAKMDSSVVIKYNTNPIETLYKEYLSGTINKFPIELRTRENLFIILNMLKREGKIELDCLTDNYLKEKFKLMIRLYENTNITEIYKRWYGEKFYYEKWKYPAYLFKEIELTPELAKTIFNNYLKAHNIAIDDPINFDYQDILIKCGISSIHSKLGGICGFFVYYWDGRYAGYQFRNIGNYYRLSDDNVINDLKFLVERELNLKIDKIPLYITRDSLRKKSHALYNHIVIKKNRSLYEYFNMIYPDKFIETDFELSRYRNNFDSVEEEQVDGILREYFGNVIYNYNNSDQVVTLKGKRPDWFIMTESGVWLVEYFGMYIKNQSNNPIIKSYIETTEEKIKLYNEMTGYNFLLVYPNDTDNNFYGLREKIRKIVEND